MMVDPEAINCKRAYRIGMTSGEAACKDCKEAPWILESINCFSLGFNRAYSKCDGKLNRFMTDSAASISSSDLKRLATIPLPKDEAPSAKGTK